LKVGDATYHWNEDYKQYLEAAFDTAFGGNWTKLDDDCYTSQNKTFVVAGCLLPDDCLARKWILEGDSCESPYVPDVFFLSVILFLGTFGLAMFCRTFRSTGYFPSWVNVSLVYACYCMFTFNIRLLHLLCHKFDRKDDS